MTNVRVGWKQNLRDGPDLQKVRRARLSGPNIPGAEPPIRATGWPLNKIRRGSLVGRVPTIKHAQPMKIGILGSGTVARTLAKGFLEQGLDIMLGTRKPSSLSDWTEANPTSFVGSFQAAAEFGDIVVLAVKGYAVEEVLSGIGCHVLEGKPVIDATNPISDAGPEKGVLPYFTTHGESLMERLQRQCPDAHFVKAFNSVGSGQMVHPSLEGGTPTMFICGDNEDAKIVVTGILHSFGWEVEDMGGVEAARAIEPLAMLWCIPGFREGSWNHAFKLLKG